jgi:hypothetical protein
MLSAKLGLAESMRTTIDWEKRLTFIMISSSFNFRLEDSCQMQVVRRRGKAAYNEVDHGVAQAFVRAVAGTVASSDEAQGAVIEF